VATNISIDGKDLISFVGFRQAITQEALVAMLTLRGGRLNEIGIAAFDKGLAASKAYETQVAQILKDIRATQTGRAILEGIEGRTSQSVSIIPYLELRPNATAGPGDWVDATPKGESIFLGGNDNATTPADERMAILGKGSGKGSTSTVRFTPQLPGYPAVPLSRSDTTRALPGDLDDETLLHELVHSYRQVTGTANGIPLSGMAIGYDDTEEFIGVVVTNVFMSELGRSVLRKNHRGYAALPVSQCRKGGFFDATTPDGKSNVDAYLSAKLDGALFMKLASVNAPFNPFRDIAEAAGKMFQDAYTYFTRKPQTAIRSRR
jgi:hypothetical protein